ncbi:jerky protein homolog-like [Hylaeus anthracinus]|uniref:jerky protein homolog-like n=1 Tax=Hylaeus anthracinus TaxID=313031 RepID=UPI0023B9B97B|nr:jerky protein homolog-like [Hylaeus anthracinus]XP_054015969.1 jerky protein homolog-like [Hylaeus anthracinus]XP_054015971.1 jerky protein homolog-like [Hylaeus anthracinus]
MSVSRGTKRVTLTIRQRLDVIRKLNDGIAATVLASAYGVNTTTIRRIKRDEDRIRQEAQTLAIKSCTRRRIRKPVQDDLEARLYSWFLQERELGNHVSNAALQDKAMTLHGEFGGPSRFRASNGWLWNFKNRYGIQLSKVYGERAHTETRTEENDFSHNFQRRREEEVIELENIYNMAETGLMWKTLPQRALLHAGELKVYGNKSRKDRVTVGFCANATGTHKLPLVFINKCEKPRALKHCWNQLPVVFKSQRNGSMSHHVFADWLENHFKPVVKRRQLQNGTCGKILLLVHSSTAHEVSRELRREDDDIEIVVLPTNNSSILQPMDRGIIATVKGSFRSRMLKRLLDFPGGVGEFYADLDVKDCIDFLNDAWMEVTQLQIRNSWKNLVANQETVKEEENDYHDILQTKAIVETLETITGETIPEDEIEEWLSTCDASELDQDETEVKEEPSQRRFRDEEEIDRSFRNIILWSQTEPDFVQLQAYALKNYYDQA